MSNNGHDSGAGSIRLFIGSMYAGKTSIIISEYKRWKAINKNVICINSILDDRYGNDEHIYSHNLDKIKCIQSDKLETIDISQLMDCDVIIVNEGQFFDDLISFCKKWSDDHKKDIVVCGLDGDYLRKPFGKITELIPLADEVTKLRALCSICKDGTLASFTLRLSDETSQIVIGSTNYKAVCRKCYIKFNKV